MSGSSPRIGLISNPGSGHNRDQFERLRARIDHSTAVQHLVTADFSDVRPALEHLAQERVDLIAINGGDGTCSAVLGEMFESGLFPRLPRIALLPGGTANMNAGDVGVRGSLTAAVNRFLDWCEAPPVRKADSVQRRCLLRVEEAGAAPRYGMFMGAGAIIQGTDYAHRELHARGLRDDFSLALGTARTAWGLLRNDPAFRQPTALELALDGAPGRHHDMLILAVSTLHRLAFGMRPFWGVEEAPLRLTVIESDCTRFARTFFSILRGRPNANARPDSGYSSHNARRFTLELDGKLNLDGEVFTPAGPLQVSASPELEFLRL